MFLITALFNCTIMHFLISFHSVGKASILHFYYFLPDGGIFSCLVDKANTGFIQVFCFCILQNQLDKLCVCVCERD